MQIKAEHITLVDIDSLTPNPNNRNKHSKEQIERLCKIIKAHGFRQPLVVSQQTGFLVAGHGRLQAAKKLGLKKVPVMFQAFDSPEQEYAVGVSDNAIASWAELDLSGINADLAGLGPDFDLDLLGLKDFELEPADKLSAENEHYTTKIEAPVYEPTGAKPLLSSLVDMKKTKELHTQIAKAQLPEELKEFLQLAAYRHTVFFYDKIAEFYAHSSKQEQELFEQSALVIVDFNQAIENGFVELTQKLVELYVEK